MTLTEAKAAIVADGFKVGTVTSSPSGHDSDVTWIVQSQGIPPGTSKPFGTPIDLVLEAPGTVCPSP
jgi:hypothetical protein